jgi:hypothetical protein
VELIFNGEQEKSAKKSNCSVYGAEVCDGRGWIVKMKKGGWCFDVEGMMLFTTRGQGVGIGGISGVGKTIIRFRCLRHQSPALA